MWILSREFFIKNFYRFSIFLSISICNAAETVQYLKEDPISFDMIQIYKDSDVSAIEKDIHIVTSPSLDASSEIVLTKDFISFKNSKVFYKDYDKCLLDKKCVLNLNQLSFLEKNKDSIYLKIEGYEKGYGVVSLINRKLYMKVDSDYFSNRFDSPQWRTVVYTKEANNKLQNYLKENISLNEFMDKLNSCVKNKNVDCLKAQAIEPVAKHIEASILYRAVFEDSKLCKLYLKEYNDSGLSGFNIPEYILKQASLNNNVVWDSLLKATKFDTNNSLVTIKFKKFNSQTEITIRNHIPPKMQCSNMEDIILTMEIINGSWKLVKFVTYEEDEPI